MANTGNIFATSGTSVANGGTAWTNPGNIVSDNGSDATCNAGSVSEFLYAKTFGFSIPGGATINGVLVRVEASEHSGGTEALFASLADDTGVAFGTTKTNTNEGNISGTTKVVYTYGSTSDTWGATITPEIANDPDFGVLFDFRTSHDVRIDFVTMQIEYTESVGPPVLVVAPYLPVNRYL